ncbi:MAG: hypothetical protein SFZ24_10390 [Planctomycetota bacterium]|nr:hypothetical protein [Planctomycetota bacterium]
MRELPGDESGQMIMEYLLLAGLIILPLAMTMPYLLEQMYLYFYRIAFYLALPFP